MQMTEEEARQVMKESGWSYLPRQRKGHTYVYAARHISGKRQEKYIGSLARLASLSIEKLQDMLK